MRVLLEASTGAATFIVSLHPGATQTLNTPEAGALNTLAPLDDRRVVHLPLLETDEDATGLVSTYTHSFRTPDIPTGLDPSFPIHPEVAAELRARFNGKIRDILAALNVALALAADQQIEQVTPDVLRNNYRTITGMVHPEEARL